MILKGFYLISVILLFACGHKEGAKDSVEASPSKASESLLALDLSYKDHFEELKGGEDYAGQWSRRFKVENPQGELWPVEKFDAAEQVWFDIGKTDALGYFTDTDVEVAAKYRFGGSLGTETSLLPGLKTLIISKSNISSEVVYIAKRVVVAKGSPIYIEGSGMLRVFADELLVDGNVFGASGGYAQRAGSAEFFVRRVYGEGKVQLSGSSGAPGGPGSRGGNGDVRWGIAPEVGGIGAQGSQGGAGGDLKIYFADAVFTPKENFSVVGGVGGEGGQGGEGGRIVYHGTTGKNEQASHGPQGPRGATGPSGNLLITNEYEGLSEKILKQLLAVTFPQKGELR